MIRHYGMSIFNCFYCPEKWVVYTDDVTSYDYFLARADVKLHRYNHTEREHKKEFFPLDKH